MEYRNAVSDPESAIHLIGFWHQFTNLPNRFNKKRHLKVSKKYFSFIYLENISSHMNFYFTLWLILLDYIDDKVFISWIHII